ncbi:aminotransferase class I/II-fold pyridoxal phosphate-dependent enzyme [Caulobacter segnis]
MLYGDPRGSGPLRESIAAMLRTERGLTVGPENICITRGSQNAIFLAARTLITPGDTVLVEALTYEPAAVAAFPPAGPGVEAVALDEQGVDVEDVERRCQEGVKAIFLTPHHQFPTTVALRPEQACACCCWPGSSASRSLRTTTTTNSISSRSRCCPSPATRPRT